MDDTDSLQPIEVTSQRMSTGDDGTDMPEVVVTATTNWLGLALLAGLAWWVLKK